MAPLNASMSLPVGVLFFNCFMLTGASLFVAMRFWSRWKKRTTLQVNDYTIIISWISTLALITVLNFAIVHGGAGQPKSEVTSEEALISSKCVVAIECLYFPAVCFSKVSAVDLFDKIFPNRGFRVAGHLFIAIVTLYCIGGILVSLVACQPFAYNWDKTIPGGHCVEGSQRYIATTSIAIVLDVMVVLLPMPMVWNLQLQTRKKIVLTVLFSLGFLICIIAISRTALYANRAWLETMSPGRSPAATIMTLLSSEACLSIIVVCIPLLQPIATSASATLRALLPQRNKSPISLRPSYKHLNDENVDKRGNRPFAGSDESKFKRLHDHLFPMSQSGGDGSVPTQFSPSDGNTTIDIEALRLAPSRSKELRELYPRGEGQNISVTREYWVVSSG